jgi:hypothetical protein
LSLPKDKIQSFDLEYFSDFENMMIKDVSPLTAYFGNNYIDTLLKISKTAQKRATNQKKFKLRQSREFHRRSKSMTRSFKRPNSLSLQKKPKEVRNKIKLKKIEDQAK